MGSNDEREQTLNQHLAEMDGFDSSKGIVVLAATNRPETDEISEYLVSKETISGEEFMRILGEQPDKISQSL